MMRTMQELWTFLDSLDWSTPEPDVQMDTDACCPCDVCQEARHAFPLDNDDN